MTAPKKSVTEGAVIDALKTEILQYEYGVERIKTNEWPDELVLCRSFGAVTWVLAGHLKVETADVRRVLNELHKQGRVLKYSRSNYSLWWPVGYLAELKATA